MASYVEDFCEMLRGSGQFDELEIRILRALVKLDKSRNYKVTASLIAKEAGLSVTNAYKYLYALQEKGLVESSENKNKIFWLAHSTNPFPRLFSKVTQDYFKKKKLFSDLESMYSKFIDQTEVWGNEKIYERYDGDYTQKAALLFDIARKEIFITTNRFFDDLILLEAVKRAVERGVKIKIIAEELHPERVEKLGKIAIEMRLGKAWPYVIVVDGKHGMSLDGADRGIFFLNHNSDYKNRFEDMWDKAEKL